MILLINGASSSGKTSLARALQEIWTTRLLYLGIDQMISQLPFSYTGQGANSEAGFPIRNGEVRVGPEGYKLNQAFCKTALHLHSFGYDLVIDYVFLDEQLFEPFKYLLKEVETLFIGLHCEPEILRRRNKERADRVPGLSITQQSKIHFASHLYDLELDSAHVSSEDLARDVIAHIGGASVK